MSTPEMTGLAGATRAITAAAMEMVGVTDERDARDIVAHTLAVAEQWARGELTLEEVDDRCTRQERWLATRFTFPHPPALARLLTALVNAEGAWITSHGVMPLAELIEVQATLTVREVDGVRRQVALLPVSHPWLVVPDPKLGVVGERRPPIFRTTPGPVYGQFSSVPLPEGGAIAYGQPRKGFWETKRGPVRTAEEAEAWAR